MCFYLIYLQLGRKVPKKKPVCSNCVRSLKFGMLVYKGLSFSKPEAAKDRTSQLPVTRANNEFFCFFTKTANFLFHMLLLYNERKYIIIIYGLFGETLCSSSLFMKKLSYQRKNPLRMIRKSQKFSYQQKSPISKIAGVRITSTFVGLF